MNLQIRDPRARELAEQRAREQNISFARRGNPAQLNLADCLSYACAKSYAMPLLYKGNDFAERDLA